MKARRNRPRCHSCSHEISAGSKVCGNCGAPLSAKLEKDEVPGQTLLDLNRFAIIAVVFILLIAPLGYCIRPG